ncbi:MAG: hypothetical protein WEA61_10865 [Anaerolineales bacterium]
MFDTFKAGVALVRQRRVLSTFAFIALFVGFYSEAWDRIGRPTFWRRSLFHSIGSLQLDTVAWFSLIDVAFILYSLLSNEIAKRIVDTNNNAQLLRALQAVYTSMALLILNFALSRSFYLSLGAMLLFDAIRSVSFPFTEAWLNLQIASKVRATVLSWLGSWMPSARC